MTDGEATAIMVELYNLISDARAIVEDQDRSIEEALPLMEKAAMALDQTRDYYEKNGRAGTWMDGAEIVVGVVIALKLNLDREVSILEIVRQI